MDDTDMGEFDFNVDNADVEDVFPNLTAPDDEGGEFQGVDVDIRDTEAASKEETISRARALMAPHLTRYTTWNKVLACLASTGFAGIGKRYAYDLSRLITQFEKLEEMTAALVKVKEEGEGTAGKVFVEALQTECARSLVMCKSLRLTMDKAISYANKHYQYGRWDRQQLEIFCERLNQPIGELDNEKYLEHFRFLPDSYRKLFAKYMLNENTGIQSHIDKFRARAVRLYLKGIVPAYKKMEKL